MRRFCLCSEPDYCERVSTSGMTLQERAQWRRDREIYRNTIGQQSLDLSGFGPASSSNLPHTSPSAFLV